MYKQNADTYGLIPQKRVFYPLELDSDELEEDDEIEKPLPLAVPVASKPSSSAPKAGSAPRLASKSYDHMVYEAMKNLNQTRRLGVSIQRILKYISVNYDLPSDRTKFYCKKAIDKGLKDDIYVHTSGVGMSGSIVFTALHWNSMKKNLKAAEKEEKRKAAAKPKPKLKAEPKKKVDQKLKATKKPDVKPNVKKSQPQKDKNNNPGTSGTAVVAKKTKPNPEPTVVKTKKIKTSKESVVSTRQKTARERLRSRSSSLSFSE